MQRSLAFILCAAGASLTLAAHAAIPVRAADLAATNNGSTGYIGLTASAGMPASRTDARIAMASTPGGELTTLVQGRPNVATESPGPDARRSATMDSGYVSARAAAAVNPAWGTPD